MPLPELHLDRARAESFGSVAEDYDLHRPNFPDPLLDDLAALGAAAVLDIGTGTGKVARSLARRGLSVLGVEVDPRMAAVARGHGVRVEVARFEEWDDAGRRFDLVTCGDAWHWMERKRAAAKIALALRPGGTFAWFWNLQLLDEPVMEALDVAYREHAPDIYVYGRLPTQMDPPPLEGPFSADEPKTYRWERRVSGTQWAAFARTISDHQRLPSERRAPLLEAIRETIDRFGETILVRGVTFAHFARRDDSGPRALLR
ncbi:MAG: class I SAM-dependent methyltransferase [Polyangiaceae bacterium]